MTLLQPALLLVGVVLLAAALGCTAAPGEAAEPASFEKLGAFVGKGGAMSRLVGPGPAGTERLYVCYTYISSLDLVAYEAGTGKPKVWRNEEGGAWAMEKGPDGRLYIGTYFGGRLLRL